MSFTNGFLLVLAEILPSSQQQIILFEVAIVKAVVSGFSSEVRDIVTIKVELVKSGKIGRSTIRAQQELLETHFFFFRLRICFFSTTGFHI